MAQVTRLAHLFLLVSLFAFAIFLGQSHPNDLNEYNQFSGLNLDDECNDSYTSDCIYRQLIYRASFVLFILFFILAIGNIFSEQANRSFWMLKFAFAFCVFFGVWWGDNSFFAGWSHFARVFSFFWLLVQGLLLLDFAYDLHDLLMFKDSESEGSNVWKILYLVLSAGFLACAFTGIVYLYADYSGCALGGFFTSVCLIFGVCTTLISMLNQVNKGLLTPCVMFAYSSFLAWYALLSNPNEECNPDADTNDGEKENAMIIISVITLTILLYCVGNGTKTLNIFNPEGEGVIMGQIAAGSKGSLGAELSPSSAAEEGRNSVPTDSPGSSPDSSEEGKEHYSGGSNFVNESSGTKHERVFFHVLMMLTSCYCAMLFTNWGRANGLPEGQGSSHVEADMSMWLKILSQWIFLILQCRVLFVAYQDNDGN